MWPTLALKRSIASKRAAMHGKMVATGLDNRPRAIIKLCMSDIKSGLTTPRTEPMTRRDRYHYLIPYWKSDISRRKHGLQHWEYLHWFPICLAAYRANNQDLL